ncbi:MAG: hypothetical protein AAF547_12425 [Actinomycetota bacterium]
MTGTTADRDGWSVALVIGLVAATLALLAAGLAMVSVLTNGPPDARFAQPDPDQPAGPARPIGELNLPSGAGEDGPGAEILAVMATIDGPFAAERTNVEVARAVLGLADAVCNTVVDVDDQVELEFAFGLSWDALGGGGSLTELFSTRDRYIRFAEAVLPWRCPDQAERLGL